ncbi:RNA-binding protein 45-like isoform X1 [Ascaphus truei]|uniref:RNA-binding protein 45-like isoform X1 n=1 Tax=Ascaphus truei TaxID=8439 RepID=UPI003F5A3754
MSDTIEDRSGFRPSTQNLDDPPNSRVFLVVSKSSSVDTIRGRFSKYGDIQDIWVVKDKHTNESKGIAFVKYAKSSQACRALERMNGRCLTDDTKPLKVFIAQSRGSSCHRDVEYEDLTKIFIVIPISYTEGDVMDKFKEYGQIQHCSIMKNKATGERKGCGFVKYLKPSQAAIAIENCDRRFKAILAKPRNKAGSATEPDYHSSARRDTMAPEHTAAMYSYEQFDYSAYDKSGEARTQEAVSKRLIVVSRLPLVQEQMYSLFNLVSGLEYCEVQPDLYMSYGVAVIQYQNIAASIYAKYKLHGFEYPPGNRLGVTFLNDGGDGTDLRKMASQKKAAQAYERGYATPQAMQLLSDAILPACKKKAPSDSESKERLFVLFKPHTLTIDVMEDVFCRFGNLIEVFLVRGKNLGYAKYTEKSSADEAIATLHGKTVNGVKLRVTVAESPRDKSNKRQRTY